MRRPFPAGFMATIAAAAMLPACIDVWITPPTYASRAVTLVTRGDTKVGTLGAPDLSAGHCTMLGESSYIFRPTGEGTFQASTTTTRAGDTWYETASVFTPAGTTILDLDAGNHSMAAAGSPDSWQPRPFHFDASLYPEMGQVEFQGECR